MKERPKCRKIIEGYLEYGRTLEEIVYDRVHYSQGLRMQARKMLSEQDNLTKVEV